MCLLCPRLAASRLVACTCSVSLYMHVACLFAVWLYGGRTHLALQVMPLRYSDKGGLGGKKGRGENPASPANSPTVAPSFSPITVSSRASSAASHPSSASYSAGQGTSSAASTPAACPPAADSPSAAALGLLRPGKIARIHALQGVVFKDSRRRSARDAAHVVADYASSAPSYTPAGSAASTPFSIISITSASPRLSSVAASSRGTTPRALSTRSGLGSAANTPRAADC